MKTTRKTVISVRLTPQERQLVGMYAKLMGCKKLSQYIRMMLFPVIVEIPLETEVSLRLSSNRDCEVVGVGSSSWGDFSPQDGETLEKVE